MYRFSPSAYANKAMYADRLGSYSIDFTVAGILSLSRLKSMIRYFFLWPPPRLRIVIFPDPFRPPIRFLPAVRLFSGLDAVTSAKSFARRWRSPGVVGLNFFNAMVNGIYFFLICLYLILTARHTNRSPRPQPGSRSLF